MAILSETLRLLGATGKETKQQQYYYGLVEKNVLVTGADGQLGSDLKELTGRINLPFRFFYTDADVLDITNRDQIDDFVRINNIRYIINCAAYTAVDKAESNRDKAYMVNVTGVENVAAAAKKYNARVIHISTDFVFDGESAVPYKEDDEVRPLNVYGETKLKGEEALEVIAGNRIIIRTSWLYSVYGRNFVKSILTLISGRVSLKVVSDEKGSPTYAADLAEMLVHILQYSENEEWKPGIYHFANRGDVSRYDFAKAIQNETGVLGCEIKPTTSKMYGAPAKRPSYSTLDTSKISGTFRIIIPHWQESLRHCINKLKNVKLTDKAQNKYI